MRKLNLWELQMKSAEESRNGVQGTGDGVLGVAHDIANRARDTVEDVAHRARDTVKYCLECSGDTVDNAGQSRRETIHDTRDGCTHSLEHCLRAIGGHLPVACEDTNEHADDRLNHADRSLNDAGDCSHHRHDNAADDLKRCTKYHGHDCGHCGKCHA